MIDQRKPLFLFSLSVVVFWLAQFLYQYYVLIPGDWEISLVRGSALAGTTLIGLALFSSAIFKWFPRTAQHWRLRRYLGVSGFIFIFFHVLGAYKFVFNFDFKAAYFSLDPLVNPIIFGSLAFVILFVMAVTSCDWAVTKLGPRRWKFIHRFVYLAYVSAIFHFVTIAPENLNNLAGYFLLIITVLAVAGQIFWFWKIVSKQRFRSRGAFIGIGLILLAIILGYAVYLQNFAQ